MKRLIVIYILLFSLCILTNPLWADDFVPALLQYMNSERVDAAELGALERHLYTYRFQEAAQSDPELIALALKYALQQGENAGTTDSGFAAQLAFQLALANHEMVKMGFEERQIVRAVLNSTRAVVRARLELGVHSPEEGQMIHQQIRQEIRNMEQAQLKIGNPQNAPGGSPDFPPGPGRDKPGKS